MKKLLFAIALIAASACAFGADKTMAELNPEFEGRMKAALTENSLALFHFTDVHSDKVEFARYCEFYKTYERYFDDAVCTGDLVEESWVNDFDYWGNTPGHEKILIALGNHDALLDHENWKASYNVWDVNLATMGETYNKFFAPFIKDWGVIYEQGKTYWYKDYPKNKVRLIALDCMLRPRRNAEDEAAQLRWFKECLMGARAKNYTVVVAFHFPLWKSEALDGCIFNWKNKPDSAWYECFDAYQEAVDKFKKKGGSFACWFGGHTHWDYTNVNPEYPDQISLCVTALTRFKCGCMRRTNGAKSQDIANALIIDHDSHTFKVVRIGCDIDTEGVVRRTMTVDYKTSKVLEQE